jgi:hypothetical protein
MVSLFAVIRTHGAAWHPGEPLETQQDWAAHASFMDHLEREGFVVLAGPLEGDSDALLVVRADGPEEVVKRLDDDPWTTLDLLRTIRVARWTLRIGSLP